MCAVAEPVGPLARHRLVEALNLPVGAWPIRLGGQVANGLAAQQLAQRAILGVDERVVGHQPFRLDAVLSEEGERAFQEGGHGRRALVVEEPGVTEARTVVDDRVRVVVADALALVLRGASPIAGDRMAGAFEASVEADIHVQQVARAGPLVAALRFALSAHRSAATSGPARATCCTWMSASTDASNAPAMRSPAIGDAPRRTSASASATTTRTRSSTTVRASVTPSSSTTSARRP